MKNVITETLERTFRKGFEMEAETLFAGILKESRVATDKNPLISNFISFPEQSVDELTEDLIEKVKILFCDYDKYALEMRKNGVYARFSFEIINYYDDRDYLSVNKNHHNDYNDEEYCEDEEELCIDEKSKETSIDENYHSIKLIVDDEYFNSLRNGNTENVKPENITIILKKSYDF